ncbi:hypothetical protein [Burkholderia cepacia]|uniref:hypothetical protein n=1 Tax=Burkholderia cepacia TaxID=292 RepID=UPI001F31D6EE|nr:hypothetical protein [Burkholderia cepacia]MCE4130273.1 hypothetical protein [Burkholderia cepacia]
MKGGAGAGNRFCLPDRRDAKAKTPRMKIRGVFFCAAESCKITTVGVTMTASDAADADHGRYASRRDQPINQAACTASQAATLSARGTPRSPAPPSKNATACRGVFRYRFAPSSGAS